MSQPPQLPLSPHASGNRYSADVIDLDEEERDLHSLIEFAHVDDLPRRRSLLLLYVTPLLTVLLVDNPDSDGRIGYSVLSGTSVGFFANW
jgi:hypothetical protein